MEKDVGTKIKLLRIRLNMSQQRFGVKIGLSGKTISAYERGKCMPPIKVLEKISEVYDFEIIQVDKVTSGFIAKLRDIQLSLENIQNELSQRLL